MLTTRLDGVTVEDLRVPAAALAAAWRDLPDDLRVALEHAAAEIRAYHEAQAPAPAVEVAAGPAWPPRSSCSPSPGPAATSREDEPCTPRPCS